MKNIVVTRLGETRSLMVDEMNSEIEENSGQDKQDKLVKQKRWRRR